MPDKCEDYATESGLSINAYELIADIHRKIANVR
jgi:hypothetical protein